MSVLRLPSSAAPHTPNSVPFGRCGYAEVADKIKLSLVLPHQAIFTSADVDRVDIPAATGNMSTLTNHVPSIKPPRPGVVEIIKSGNALKNSVVSGCFTTVHPNKLMISTILPASSLTAFPLLPFAARTTCTASKFPSTKDRCRLCHFKHCPYLNYTKLVLVESITTIPLPPVPNDKPITIPSSSHSHNCHPPKSASTLLPPFVLEGFATVHPNEFTINVVEAAPLESPLLIKSDLPASPSTTLPLLSSCRSEEHTSELQSPC